MLNPFKPGDQKIYEVIVQQQDIAAFADGGIIHEVYSTFAITRDAEWACRLFVNEMLETDEEGIGSFVEVKHLAPAKVGTRIKVISTFESLQKNEIICSFKSLDQDRIIASGSTGQKILKRSRLEQIMASI